MNWAQRRQRTQNGNKQQWKRKAEVAKAETVALKGALRDAEILAIRGRKNFQKESHKKSNKRKIKPGGLFNESKRNEYMQCLMAPEIHMARIPFLIGLPTAVCHLRSIYSFSALGGGWGGAATVLGFSFIPNAILAIKHTGAEFSAPLGLATCSRVNGDPLLLDTWVTNYTLFPQLHGDGIPTPSVSSILTKMTQAWIVGASINVSRTDKIFNRCGEMHVAWTFQDVPELWSDRKVDWNAIRLALFSETAILPENEVRMNLAPMDYQDLNMIPIGPKETAADNHVA